MWTPPLFGRYLMDPEDEDECLEKSVGCNIHWKDGKNVTVAVVEKKQKKKGKVRLADAPGDAPRCGEVWGDVARSGEIWRGLARCRAEEPTESIFHLPNMAATPLS